MEEESSSGSGPLLPITGFDARSFFDKILKNLKLFKDSRHALDLDLRDTVLLMVIIAVSVIISVFRIQFPKLIFDKEMKGILELDNYLKGRYFYTENAPFCYQVAAFFCRLLDYPGDLSASQGKYDNMYYVSLRIMPALFSALCSPLSYIIMRLMRCSQSAAVVTSLLFATDLLYLVTGREVSIDGYAHFFACLSLLSVCAFEFYQSFTAFVFECLFVGLGIASDYKCFAVLAVAVVSHIDKRRGLVKIGILVASSLAILVSAWIIHVSVLPFGDYKSNMPEQMRIWMVNEEKPQWRERNGQGSVVKRAIDLMLYRDKTVRRVDDFPLLTFPFACDVFRVVCDVDSHRRIALIGNPFTWIPVIGAVVMAGLKALVDGELTMQAALVAGYLVALLECKESSDYTMCLLFGFILLVRSVEELPKKVRGFVVSALVSGAVYGFWFWSPLGYAFYVPDWKFLGWK